MKLVKVGRKGEGLDSPSLSSLNLNNFCTQFLPTVLVSLIKNGKGI